MNPTENPSYSILVMPQSEIETAIGWAQKEGWNPGINDAVAFYAADPTGFLVGKYDGKPVATISAVKYGSTFGFIGLYIVAEEFRGRGFGFQIWLAAIASLASRNIGLDGVVAQQDNYKKSGFKLAHRNIRYAGQSPAHTKAATHVVEAGSLDFNTIAAYDRKFFPEERTAFLQHWISPENSITLAIVEKDQVLGLGSIRACDVGYKIGPLNAENADLAHELFLALTATVPEGSPIFLDVPEPNKNAIQLAESFGMSPVFETARMYTKEFPPLPLDKIFGITTFELG